jgi:hypothetical protein
VFCGKGLPPHTRATARSLPAAARIRDDPSPLRSSQAERGVAVGDEQEGVGRDPQ